MAPEAYARQQQVPVERLLAQMTDIKRALYQRREKRARPFRDEKIITAWNSLMISALTDGYRIFGEESYLQTALRAANFLWQHMWREDTTDLLRIHYLGQSTTQATQPDYAYFTAALLDLYDVTAQTLWLTRAKTVTNAMIEQFWDDERGGFWMTQPGKGGSLITTPKSLSDSPIPSGNAVALHNFARLSRRTDELHYRTRLQETLAAFAETINRHPERYSYLLLGLTEARHGNRLAPHYFASGVGRVHGEILHPPASERISAETTEAVDFTLHVEMAEGWHINAHEPNLEFLVPTEITVPAHQQDTIGQHGRWELSNVLYPQPHFLPLGFVAQSIALYTGQVDITGTMISPDRPDIRVLPLTLQLQACDERRCLAPETLKIPLAYGSLVAQ